MAEEKNNDLFDDEYDEEDEDWGQLFAQLSELENAEMRLNGTMPMEQESHEEETAQDIFNDIFSQMGGFEQMEGSAMNEIRSLMDDMEPCSGDEEFDEESLKDEEAYVDLMKRLEALNSLENFRAWDQFQEEYSDDEEESEDTKENK